MGILIKNIELPRNDDEYVIITVYGDGGVVYGPLNRPHVRYKNRAVPVPPHGRLIDADALEHDYRENAEDAWNKEASPISWADAFDELADMVADAPTIIPADLAEEEMK